MFIRLWSWAHASPRFLPDWAGSSLVELAAKTAAIAAILRVSYLAILITHNGMLPCFLAGLSSSLSSSIPSALHNLSRVWLGSITSSR